MRKCFHVHGLLDDTTMSGSDLQQMNHFMLSKQHLTYETKVDDVVQVLNDVFGLHATNATTSYLSLVSRVRYFKRVALDEEHYVRRLGKIRCERKTVYIVCRESSTHIS